MFFKRFLKLQQKIFTIKQELITNNIWKNKFTFSIPHIFTYYIKLKKNIFLTGIFVLKIYYYLIVTILPMDTHFLVLTGRGTDLKFEHLQEKDKKYAFLHSILLSTLFYYWKLFLYACWLGFSLQQQSYYKTSIYPHISL